jgi:maltose alpha-D-glucosyltransferase/alpha-amylase
MLRSFDYAAWAALFDQTTVRPDAVEALLPYAVHWRVQVEDAFLAGYRDAIDACPSYPSEERVARDLIALFALEKALYEIVYEAGNRPSWLRIPVEGILRLIEAQ